MQLSRHHVSPAVVVTGLTFTPREAQCGKTVVLRSPLHSCAHIQGDLCLHSPPTNVAAAHPSLQGGGWGGIRPLGV